MLPIQSEPLRALIQARRFDQALVQAQAELRDNMHKFTAWSDLAAVHYAAGRLDKAQAALDEAIQRFNQYSFLFCLRAYVKHQAKDYDSSLNDLREAERRAPEDISILNNLAAALMDLEKHEEAIGYLQRVLAVDPKYKDALTNLSAIYMKLKRVDEAIGITEKQLSLMPDDPDIYLSLLNQLRGGGRLSRFRELFDPQRTRHAFATANRPETFNALTYIDDPAWHLALARRQALRVAHYPLAPPPERVASRPRIGYWSCDFYDHATSQLITEVFELHDRNKFEIFILSYGVLKGDAAELRIRQGVEHFLDFSADSDAEAVARIAALDLDILVDLKGYTGSTRMAVPFAHPARVVVSWLGYPGSLGNDKIDYILGDKVVTPPGCEPFYDEKILALAGSYQPNDSKQKVARALPRAAYELPEDAIVLAAFNAVHKITPEIFDIWMRALRRNERLYLWLFSQQEFSFQQLRQEARQRGVDERRLVLAGVLKRPEHIARYQVADLALDCFPYGSHTTGSDALRSGCPLLALEGRSFAARVSASLLSAVDLPELITGSPEAYEAKLMELT
ncbi:MAG: tetratricopeptide repeat protein, partial [Pseudomonadales bacterium]|nr:tetratricopeptide repeat protein [Pseudomonadales bacterium]